MAGEYTAVLSLTDYPDEKPSNATITVLKEKYNCCYLSY